MKEYKKYLLELFDSKTDFKEQIFKETGYGNFYNYETEIEDNIINVTFRDNMEDFESLMNTGGLPDIKDVYEMGFSIYPKGDFESNTYDLTGKNRNMFIIFGKVSNILKHWISKAEPNAFYFSAKEPKRKKLYDKFAQQIEKETNYKQSNELELIVSAAVGMTTEKYYGFIKK
jgi:hypothetical protein